MEYRVWNISLMYGLCFAGKFLEFAYLSFPKEKYLDKDEYGASVE
jgi:hypothetical protein